MDTSKMFSTRNILICTLGILIATFCGSFSIDMPMGGSATFCSMFFISILGYWFGPVAGILSGVLYGLIDMILNPYIVSVPQALVDYILAFGCLGLSGFFRNKKNGMVVGYLASITGRFFCAALSGVIFFGMYAPEGMNPIVYSVVYNGIYIYFEGILTVFAITIPMFQELFDKMKVDYFS